MEREVTFDPEAKKNRLAQKKLPHELEDQVLEASDTLVTVEEPATHHFFIL